MRSVEVEIEREVKENRAEEFSISMAIYRTHYMRNGKVGELVQL